MSDLVFIAFENEKKAEEVRDKILGMQKEYLIEVSDAVIATRDENGRVKLNQLMHPAATGALSGAFWGLAGSFLCRSRAPPSAPRRERWAARSWTWVLMTRR
jgi:uncharacterized membrane protein